MEGLMMSCVKKLIICFWITSSFVESRTEYSDFPNYEEPAIYINKMAEERVNQLRLNSLRGFYSKLRNIPELMFRRFEIGAKPPIFVPDNLQNVKRSGLDLVHAEPVCPFKAEWQLIRRATDINDNEVIVYQPSNRTASRSYQWFYTITCDVSIKYDADLACPGCCKGINIQRYESSCMPKKSYIMAFVRKPSDASFDWNWIQIDTGCSCAISPKLG